MCGHQPATMRPSIHPCTSLCSFKIGRTVFVDDIDIKRQIESQRIGISRRQCFASGSVRLEVEVLLRRENDHINGQEPSHNDVIVLTAGEIPMNSAFVELAADEVDPRIFVFVRTRLRRPSPQKLVISSSKMCRPILTVTASIKPLPLRHRVIDVHLPDLIMVVHRIVFLPICSGVALLSQIHHRGHITKTQSHHIPDGEFIVFQRFQMIVIECSFDGFRWRKS